MSHDKQFAVYILASRRNGTLYIGVTSILVKRVWEHKEGFVEGFTREHGVTLLVWFELHDSAESAITREKQLKKWNRAWKVRLIEEVNPYWNDLYSTLGG
jgi:putative endonuclease